MALPNPWHSRFRYLDQHDRLDVYAQGRFEVRKSRAGGCVAEDVSTSDEIGTHWQCPRRPRVTVLELGRAAPPGLGKNCGGNRRGTP